jgi:GT2 family glycosyltransferase
MICISVVIPTYRRPALLEKCLVALRRQALPQEAFEILVVSDGYDETTRQLVMLQAQAHPGLQLRYLYLPEKKGPAAARNLGWQQARAQLVAFTDDDTLPQEGWLQAYLAAYAQQELAAFTGKVIVPLDKNPTDYAKNTAGLETAEFVTANCCCTVQALQRTGGFDEAFRMAWREDSDLHFKLLQKGIPVQHIAAAAIVHPVREAPWGVSIREQKKSMFNALLYKKFPELYRARIMAAPLWNYYAMLLVFFLLIGCLAAGQWVSAAVAGILWLCLVAEFTARRLQGTSRHPNHIAEMLVTSAVIPFLSVYWTLYGSVRYKVLFF